MAKFRISYMRKSNRQLMVTEIIEGLNQNDALWKLNKRLNEEGDAMEPETMSSVQIGVPDNKEANEGKDPECA